MTFRRKIITWAVGISFIYSNCIYAHSGGTNSDGCHNDNINGGYHCHNSNDSSSSSSSSSEDAGGLLLIVLAVGVVWWLLSDNEDNLTNNSLSKHPDTISNNFSLTLAPASQENLDGAVIDLSYAF